MHIIKHFAVLLGVIGLAWLTIGVGLSNLLGSASPGRAHSIWPYDARVRANIGERGSVLLVQNPALAADVDRLARAALSRDPTIVDAWRLLGLVSSVRNEEGRATGILRFAERVSRRDLLVQLWLIEDQVRRDDVVGALRHYDVALRTSPTSRQLLLPILVAASKEPNVARPLTRILAANPAWRIEYTYALTHSAVTGDTVPMLVQHLLSGPVERETLHFLPQRLATAGDYENAWRVYSLLKGSPSAARAALIRDGTFSSVGGIGPFDWFMANEGAIRGERRIRSEGGEDSALFVSAEAGSSGDGARQLLLLAPGSYALSALVGSVPESTTAGIVLRLACQGEPPRVLAEAIHTPTQPAGSLQQLRFNVPAACPAQTLTFEVRSRTEIGESEAWIDNVSISRS